MGGAGFGIPMKSFQELRKSRGLTQEELARGIYLFPEPLFQNGSPEEDTQA